MIGLGSEMARPAYVRAMYVLALDPNAPERPLYVEELRRPDAFYPGSDDQYGRDASGLAKISEDS